MKRCPECRRDYYDDTLLYCLDDGNALLEGPASGSRSEPPASAGGQFVDEPATANLSEPGAIATGFPDDEPKTEILSEPGAIATGFPASESPTRAQIHTTDQTAIFPRGAEAEPQRNLGDSSERQSHSAHRAAKSLGGRTKLLVGLGIVVLFLVGGFFAYRYFSPAKQIDSIAVMPFENKSADADTDYLSDGLAESLIFQLSQLPDLKVSPASSVMRYKGKETDTAQISKELGVDAVMTGRLLKRGDNLNITVELVDTRNNKSLWGEQYERKLSALLTTQREIATEIINKLKLKLSGESEQKLAKKYTVNSEAFQRYLKGRYFWNKRTLENIRKSIEQFKAAAEIDSNYALAYAGLADSYAVLPFYGLPSSEVLPQARAYALRALEIDDSLSEAHTSLAFINTNLWNWAEAEKGYLRAIELNPNYAHAHKWYGDHLGNLGRLNESLREHKRAEELEPLSLIVILNVAERYLALGDLKAALEQCQRAVDLDPDWYFARQLMGLIYLKQGRNAEALAEAEKSVELSDRQSWPLGVLGYVYAQTGKRSEARAVLKELEERYAKRQAMGHDIARVYVGLGDKEQAFAWLEKDFQSRDSTMAFWLYQVPLISLLDDQRFQDLVKRMGMPE